MAKENSPFVGLAHVAIYPVDLEREIDFYTNALDFEIVDRKMLGDPEKPEGMYPMDFCLLRLGDFYLELMQPYGPWNGTEKDKRHPNVIGTIDHMGIYVNDLEKAMKQVKDWGYEGEMRVSYHGDEHNERGEHKGACVIWGPEGEHINLYNHFN